MLQSRLLQSTLYKPPDPSAPVTHIDFSPQEDILRTLLDLAESGISLPPKIYEWVEHRRRQESVAIDPALSQEIQEFIESLPNP
jgi:hypothetical protein